MNRKILIEIPGAGEVNCDGCSNLIEKCNDDEPRVFHYRACYLFDVTTPMFHDNMPRPQACLDAERAAKDA